VAQRQIRKSIRKLEEGREEQDENETGKDEVVVPKPKKRDGKEGEMPQIAPLKIRRSSGGGPDRCYAWGDEEKKGTRAGSSGA